MVGPNVSKSWKNPHRLPTSECHSRLPAINHCFSPRDGWYDLIFPPHWAFKWILMLTRSQSSDLFVLGTGSKTDPCFTHPWGTVVAKKFGENGSFDSKCVASAFEGSGDCWRRGPQAMWQSWLTNELCHVLLPGHLQLLQCASHNGGSLLGDQAPKDGANEHKRGKFLPIKSPSVFSPLPPPLQ